MDKKTVSKDSIKKNKRQALSGRCLIAGAGSGSGKTTVTCGIIGALKERGYDIASFKCGPDYIDPMFHRVMLGAPSENLDTYLAGADGVRGLVAACPYPAVIEGVMGIYDGISVSGTAGSSYEIAQITNTPVILVMDASGAGRTIVSMIKGILADDENHLIKGIILNRSKSGICDLPGDVRILGHIPKMDELSVGSRHLGLMLPHEAEEIRKKIRLAASVMEEMIDMDALIDIMNSAEDITPYEASVPEHDAPAGGTARIAVADDEAFCFYYPENFRMLEKMGVLPVRFSPLHDKGLPKDVSGVMFGGGYPELYLEQLSSNRSMLTSVRENIAAGMPSIAECGGFMYLHRAIEDRSGKEYEMAGVIDGKCRYTGHLVNFGYAEVTQCDKIPELKGLRGHEFHYYDSDAAAEDVTFTKPSTLRRYRGMIAGAGRLWGFAHFYYRSCPQALSAFVKEVKRYGS